MARKILDSSVLVSYWRDRAGDSLADWTTADARAWANALIELHGTDAIVTPVHLEFVVGALSAHELRLAQAYLGQFRIIDNGRVLPRDWEEALRIGQRVPRTPYRRQLGDCLVRAIANRFHCDVVAFDTRFPR